MNNGICINVPSLGLLRMVYGASDMAHDVVVLVV